MPTDRGAKGSNAGGYELLLPLLISTIPWLFHTIVATAAMHLSPSGFIALSMWKSQAPSVHLTNLRVFVSSAKTVVFKASLLNHGQAFLPQMIQIMLSLDSGYATSRPAGLVPSLTSVRLRRRGSLLQGCLSYSISSARLYPPQNSMK